MATVGIDAPGKKPSSIWHQLQRYSPRNSRKKIGRLSHRPISWAYFSLILIDLHDRAGPDDWKHRSIGSAYCRSRLRILDAITSAIPYVSEEGLGVGVIGSVIWSIRLQILCNRGRPNSSSPVTELSHLRKRLQCLDVRIRSTVRALHSSTQSIQVRVRCRLLQNSALSAAGWEMRQYIIGSVLLHFRRTVLV
jgi:hypothetical protein